jgi:hypothetical protein
MWISHGAGVARFNRITNQFIHISTLFGWIIEDKSKKLWLLYFDRTRLYYFDETTETFQYVPLPDIPLPGKKNGSSILLHSTPEKIRNDSKKVYGTKRHLNFRHFSHF